MPAMKRVLKTREAGLGPGLQQYEGRKGSCFRSQDSRSLNFNTLMRTKDEALGANEVDWNYHSCVNLGI